MYDQISVALIIAVPPTVVSAVSLVIGIRNQWKIQEIHLATNSMKDALVLATREAAHAQGMADQRTEDMRPGGQPMQRLQEITNQIAASGKPDHVPPTTP